MNIHVNNLGTASANEKLSERERLLVGMMHQSGRFSVDDIAETFGVSRQTVHNLGKTANSFLSRFPEGELFSPLLVITDQFIEIATLVLAVNCKVNYEDVVFATETLFGKKISLSSITKTINQYGDVAETFNKNVDLSGINAVAIDEIFKNDHPYLTGIDPDSTYVFLMNPEKNRTGETWQGALDQLKPQGFNPDISISDAGGGMKLGLGLAFPDCVQHGDVFHNLWDLGRSVFNVQRKALARLEEHSREEYQVFYGKNWVNKTAAAYERDDAAIDSILVQADNINILYGWAKELMNFSGYSKATTVELLGWVLDEMQNEIHHSGNLNHAVNTLRKRLDCATSFIDQLNTKMMATAETLRIPLQTFHLLYRQRTYPVGSAGYGFITDRVVRLLHGSKELMVEVASTLDYLIADTKRASSIVENLNSRIRIYLNDKRGFGHSFAQLLQLAINTKRYRRSRADGRRSKSPLQLLSGDSRSFLDVLIPDWRLHVAVAA